MIKKTIEQYLKKKVQMKLFDGEEIEGYLMKWEGKPNSETYYFLIDEYSNLVPISRLIKVSNIEDITLCNETL